MWSELLPELKLRVASFAHPNDVCSLKLIDSDTTALLQLAETPERPNQEGWRSSQTHRAMQPWPGQLFVAHWGRPEPWRSLTLPHRQRLLCLAASSGHMPSLDAALAHCGCDIPPEALISAAAAGHAEVCERLLAEGANNQGSGEAAYAAAEGGHTAVLQLLLRGKPKAEWLQYAARGTCAGGRLGLMVQLQDKYRFRADALACAKSAAAAGQIETLEALLPQLRERWAAAAAGAGMGPGAEAGGGAAAGAVVGAGAGSHPELRGIRDERTQLLEAIARGCPVEALQRHYDSLWSWGAGLTAASGAGAGQLPAPIPLRERGADLARLILAIVNSPTPCWAAKLDWLCSRWGPELVGQLLRGERGVRMDLKPATPDFTARLRHLHQHAAGMRPSAQQQLQTGIAGAHPPGFRTEIQEQLLKSAVQGGHADAVTYLLDECGVPARCKPWHLLATYGEPHAMLAVLRLLWERGCVFTAKQLAKAADCYYPFTRAEPLGQLIEATVDGDEGPGVAQQHWSRLFYWFALRGASLPLLKALRARGAAIHLGAVARDASVESLEWAAAELEAELGAVPALTYEESRVVTLSGNTAAADWLAARGLFG